jgi:WhiB family redox-sensing transcriptional regulator
MSDSVIESLAIRIDGQDQSWKQIGLCRGVDPDLFFPERGGDVRTPKAICQQCVIQERCLEFALTNAEKFGIWGGKSERERRHLRSARRRLATRAA